MSGPFINLPWTVKRAKRPDNVGGYDWSVMDSTGAVVAEAFEIVGGKPGAYDARNAHLLASMIADMANKTGALDL